GWQGQWCAWSAPALPRELLCGVRHRSGRAQHRSGLPRARGAGRMKIIPAKRVSRTYTQQLIGSPASVFPLLCPVREADWIQGWDPLLVVSESGVAEPDCAFVTAALPSNALWY